MSVILTSFRNSDTILTNFPNVEAYSVARRQPKGYFYPELSTLAPMTSGLYSKPLTLTAVGGSIDKYKEEYIKKLSSHDIWLKRWLNALCENKDIMLCCWCPHSNSTRKQIKTYGNFVCHTGLIGMLINRVRPDIDLWLDVEHAELLIPQWKPQKYKTIGVS